MRKGLAQFMSCCPNMTLSRKNADFADDGTNCAVDFDDEDDDEDDEVAAFLPIFLPIDRNYESKYLFQFVDKKTRIKRRSLQEGQSCQMSHKKTNLT